MKINTTTSEQIKNPPIKPPILQFETHMKRSDHQSKTKAVTPLAHEENVYMVKLSEQAQRYEEVEFMEKVSAAVRSSPSRSETFSLWHTRTRSA